MDFVGEDGEVEIMSFNRVHNNIQRNATQHNTTHTTRACVQGCAYVCVCPKDTRDVYLIFFLRILWCTTTTHFCAFHFIPISKAFPFSFFFVLFSFNEHNELIYLS